MSVDPEFDRLIAEAVAAPFSGWDFSWLEGRRVEEEETGWDYEERARTLVRRVASLIDLGKCPHRYPTPATAGGDRCANASWRP